MSSRPSRLDPDAMIVWPEEWPHPLAMTREELHAVVSAMSWMLLDLAQHLNFMNLQFEEGGRKGPEDDDAEGYRAAERMAYAIGSFPYDGPTAIERAEVRRTPGMSFIDGRGGFSL